MNKNELFITGFKPFLDFKENPSMDLVNSLKAEGYIGKVFRVSYQDIHSYFSKDLKDKNFKYILSFGLANDREVISLEKFAYNETNQSTVDSDGIIPINRKITDDSKDILSTSLDVDDLVKILKKAGFKAEASTNPGRYVCNYIYYNSLLAMANNALFVHLPMPKTTKQTERIFSASLLIVNFILNVQNS